jgi:four helix bundle protein
LRKTGDWRQEKEIVSEKILRHQDLIVYKKAIEAAMKIFELSKAFPKEETYSLTDQIRRASRSVPANTAEAWRKRIYKAAFISKLNDAEGEAAETQTWLEIACRCQYVERETAKKLYSEYDEIISMLTAMARNPNKWLPHDAK